MWRGWFVRYCCYMGLYGVRRAVAGELGMILCTWVDEDEDDGSSPWPHDAGEVEVGVEVGGGA